MMHAKHNHKRGAGRAEPHPTQAYHLAATDRLGRRTAQDRLGSSVRCLSSNGSSTPGCSAVRRWSSIRVRRIMRLKMPCTSADRAKSAIAPRRASITGSRGLTCSPPSSSTETPCTSAMPSRSGEAKGWICQIICSSISRCWDGRTSCSPLNTSQPENSGAWRVIPLQRNRPKLAVIFSERFIRGMAAQCFIRPSTHEIAESACLIPGWRYRFRRHF